MIFKSLEPIKTTEVYDAYWKFAAERQEIFFKRVKNNKPPWTNDPILQYYKFTNAYRASDKVSQFLIKNVIYKGEQSPKELFFRILLFKLFNKIETWNLLLHEFKEITYKDYSFEKYNSVLNEVLDNKFSIYSGAYIMASANKFGYKRKHSNHLKLIELMIKDFVPEKITESKKLLDVFFLLKSYPSFGDFLAYQLTIDLNYSELINFEESEFVIPGPGAYDGISKCFTSLGGLNESEVIRIVCDRQELEFEQRNIKFKNLFGRRLQLIDCQNLFCEISKYSRVAFPTIQGSSGRTRIKQIFNATSKSFNCWYPPKWNINQRINDIKK
ncbi:MAG: hypothetical protein JST55_01855 [Bacteroidetes bacterium]|nr:hypothetical protein [Bacteroidota bacterium]